MMLLFAAALAAQLETMDITAEARGAPVNLGFETAAEGAEQAIERARVLLADDRHTEALELLTPLAEDGDSRAQAAIGLLYARGQGAEQDLKTARHWLEQAAAQDERWVRSLQVVSVAGGLVGVGSGPRVTTRRDRFRGAYPRFQERTYKRYTHTIDYIALRRPGPLPGSKR
ncbi:MAG: hypothetical protein AAGE01_17595 [Pseudomonadota bacterium]